MQVTLKNSKCPMQMHVSELTGDKTQRGNFNTQMKVDDITVIDRS